MIRLIFLISLTFNFIFVSSQDKYNIDYFIKLKDYLKRDSSIKEYKFIEDKYWGGQIKQQLMLVKYKDDPIDRYWRLGKSFSYFKNGKIAGIDNVDLINKVLVDTLIGYYRNGNIHMMIIWQNDTDYTQILLKDVFQNSWISYPVRYKMVSYFKSGGKFYEQDYGYFNGHFDYDGDVIYYDKKTGLVDEKYKYIKGKKIK